MAAPWAAPWTHNTEKDVKDPINLRFTAVNWDVLLQQLNQARWRSPSSFGRWILATDQYLHLGSQKKVQNEHRVKMLKGFVHQYHVRLWRMEDDILGSAHLEMFTPFGGHKVLSFEQAEKELADDLAALGRSIDYDSENLGNYLQDPPNNGFATKITR